MHQNARSRKRPSRQLIVGDSQFSCARDSSAGMCVAGVMKNKAVELLQWFYQGKNPNAPKSKVKKGTK